MDISISRGLLLTGSGEGELKAWKIDYSALANGLSQTQSGEVSDEPGLDLCSSLDVI